MTPHRPALVALFAGFSACAAPDAGQGSAPDGSTPDAGVPALGEVSAQQLHEELKNKDFLLVNVHVPRSDGVLPGTDASIPYTDVDGLAQYVGPDLGRKVVLTCLGGFMSRQAGLALAGRGCRAVRELKGGMNAWVAAGYPLDP